MTMRPSEVVRRWEHEVRAAVSSARASRPEPGDVGPVVLTAHLMGAPCPARARTESTEEYPGESPRLGARRVALAALAEHRGSPPERVRAVLDAPEGLDDSLRAWVRSLGPAARVGLEAAAVAWVTDALALGAHRSEPVWSTRGLRWRDDELHLDLRAGFDARRGPSTDRRLLLVRSRPGPGDGEAARFVALVYAVSCGVVPARVSLGYRSPLEHRHLDVGESGLAVAVEEVVRRAGWQRHGDAPAVAGEWCGHCPYRGDCPEGESASSARRTVWAGLLPALPGEPSTARGDQVFARRAAAQPEPGASRSASASTSRSGSGSGSGDGAEPTM